MQTMYGGCSQAVHPLKEQLPIERARMRLKIQIPSGSREELMALLQSRQATIESQDLGLSNNQVMTASHMLQMGLTIWPDLLTIVWWDTCPCQSPVPALKCVADCVMSF